MTTGLPVCLVTGGAGYVGAVTVDRLRRAGHRVRVLDVVEAPQWPGEPPDTYLRGDICDRHAVEAACAGVDWVIHCVAHVPLHRDLDRMRAVNVDGTARLLQAAAAAGVAKVVAVSSSSVIGVPPEAIVDETVVLRPQDPYGCAKAEAETICRDWARRGLDVTVVRPRTVVSRGRLGIFQILFEWIRTGRDIPVLDGGRNLYQFVHGEDLADALVRAAGRKGPTTYHIGTDRYGTMGEALGSLVRHANTGSRVVSLPRRLTEPAMHWTSALGLSPLGGYHALMYGKSLAFDVTQAKKELNWQPRWDNRGLLIEAYDDYVASHEAIKHQRGASAHRSAVRQRALALLPLALRWLPSVQP